MKRRIWFIPLIFVLVLCSKVAIAFDEDKNNIEYLWQQIKTHHKESPDLAMDYANQLEILALKKGDNKRLASAIWTKAVINRKKGRYNESILNFLRVLDLYKALDDQKHESSTYHNLGLIYISIKSYDNAQVFFNKELDLAIRLNDTKRITGAYYELGFCYLKLKDYNKAQISLDAAKKLTKEINPYLYRNTLNLIGQLHSEQGNLEKSLANYNEYHQLAYDEKHLGNQAIALMNIGEVYLLKGDLDAATTYATKSLKLRQEINDVDKTLMGLSLMADIAMRKGDPKEAIAQLMDGIVNADNEILNHNLLDALTILTKVANAEYLSKEEYMMISHLSIEQANLSTTLLKSSQQLLDEYSLKLSVEKFEADKREQVLKQKERVLFWTIALGSIAFLCIGFGIYKHADLRKLRGINKYAQKAKTAQEEASKAKIAVAKKEIDSLEKTALLASKEIEIKELDWENKELMEMGETNNNMMGDLVEKLVTTNELMMKMNKYIWQVIRDVQENGYNPPPPPWDFDDFDDLNDRLN